MLLRYFLNEFELDWAQAAVRSGPVSYTHLIRKDVADYERLVREGCAPVAYQSLKQRLLYLHASMIFATHSAVHSFCGFSKWEVRFVQDRCV